MSWTVDEIAGRVDGTVSGSAAGRIEGLAGLADAGPNELSFLSNPRYAAMMPQTRAGAVLVRPDWQGECPAALIRVSNPDRALAQLAAWMNPPLPAPEPGLHPTAVVASDAQLAEDVHAGPHVVIGRGARIGAGTILEAQVVIGDGAVVGRDCHLYPLVSVREGCRIGDRVRVHNGAVIGSDGFGYTVEPDGAGGVRVEKIPQNGIVIIDDDVEIGANTTIDRARFGATRIGRGVKIDNLVQIAHNVRIGAHSGVVAQVGISGSTRIGSRVMLWGQAGLAGHLCVGDGAQVAAQAGVHKDVPPETFVVGTPAEPRRTFVRKLLLDRDVQRLRARVDELDVRLRTVAPREKAPGS